MKEVASVSPLRDHDVSGKREQWWSEKSAYDVTFISSIVFIIAATFAGSYGIMSNTEPVSNSRAINEHLASDGARNNADNAIISRIPNSSRRISSE